MKIRWITLIAFFVFFLESTLLQYIRPFGVMLDLSLIVIVVLAMIHGEKTGYLAALICGALRDLIYSEVIGVNVLIFVTIVWLLGKLGRTYFKDNYLTSFILTFVMTIIYNLMYYCVNFVFDYRFNLDQSLSIMTVQPFINGLMAYVIYRFAYRRPKMHHLE